MFRMPPILRSQDLTRATPSTVPAQVHPTSSSSLPDPLPASGPAMSRTLVNMARKIDQRLNEGASFMEKVRGSAPPLPRIAGALQEGVLRKKSQRNDLSGKDVLELIDRHRGPIVFLGLNGRPQFYFERHDGKWQAYHALDNSPCTPNRSPEEVLGDFDQRPGTLYNVLHSSYEKDRSGSVPSSLEDVLVIEPPRAHRSDTAFVRSQSQPLAHDRPSRVEDGDEGDDFEGQAQGLASRPASPRSSRSRPGQDLHARVDDPDEDGIPSGRSSATSARTTRTTTTTAARFHTGRQEIAPEASEERQP